MPEQRQWRAAFIQGSNRILAGGPRLGPTGKVFTLVEEAPSPVREGGDGATVTPLARIRELSIHDGEEDLEQLDEFSYSWFRGHEVLRADGVEYRGVFHPGDGCCQGNPCRYCGRAFFEEAS